MVISSPGAVVYDFIPGLVSLVTVKLYEGRGFLSLSGHMSTAWSVSDKGLCGRAWKRELL